MYEHADLAIVGIPFITTYPGSKSGTSLGQDDATSSLEVDSRDAARSIRMGSQQPFAGLLDHYDFDVGNEVLAGRQASVLDCGDVVMNSDDAQNIRTTTETIKALISKGAVPIVIGGDHATTIPVLRAFEGYESICVVQVDAHLDWRDHYGGVFDGCSSPMRRASEMPWVTSMIQIGLRGIGSAKRKDVEDAIAYGSVLVTAERLHDCGMEDILHQVPSAENYYITIDIDGLDPSIAPGTQYPAPGGLTYYQIMKLLRGLASKGKIVGLDLVEFVPELDLNNLTSRLAARVIVSFIGILIASGQVGLAPPT
jgi:agmatinase